jgi:signal peptidase I
MVNIKTSKGLKKFWKFLQEDSWPSFAVTLVIAFIIIKFIFFPVLSLITGTSLPLVIVESCSMHHYEDGFEKIFESDIYENYGIEIEETEGWAFEDGFSKGDVIFVVAPKNIEVGDVIIFDAGHQHPLIHRVVDNGNILATKGDNYKTNDQQLNSEKRITEEQLIGKALFRVPFVGWAKLIFFEANRPASQRGLCK